MKTNTTLFNWMARLNEGDLRSLQSLAQTHIAHHERVRVRLRQITANYDLVGTVWTSTVVTLAYLTKPGYMVIDGVTPISGAHSVDGIDYQLIAEGRAYRVGYNHPLAVYRVHDELRLLRDSVQRQLSAAFRQGIAVAAYPDLRYRFRINVPGSKEYLFTRSNLRRYLRLHIERLDEIERVTMRGQGERTEVEVCLRLL